MDFKSIDGTRLVSRAAFPPRAKATLVSNLRSQVNKAFGTMSQCFL